MNIWPLKTTSGGDQDRPANIPDLVGTVPIFSLCPDCPNQNLIVPILELFDTGRLIFFFVTKISECSRWQEMGVNISIFSPGWPSASLFKLFIKDIQDLLPKQPRKIGTENFRMRQNAGNDGHFLKYFPEGNSPKPLSARGHPYPCLNII